MPRLSFSALLTKTEDVQMKDAPPLSLRLPSLDFDLELNELELDLVQGIARQDSPDLKNTDIELRSPRTPTFKGELSHGFESIVPFDAERFLNSPIASPKHETSPLAALAYSPAAKTRLNLSQELAAEKENRAPRIPPPPKSPLLWIWTCHLCRSRYPLGATRRCLIDGHYYCSGDNSDTQKNVKKKKRGQACSSEFDYVGWQEWGQWKGDIVATQKRTAAVLQSVPDLKGCGGCEYPSECRYERMNKVPDVVAALPKKMDRLVELEATTTGTTGKKDATSKHEKKRTLRVETGSSFGRKNKKKDQTCPKSGKPPLEEDQSTRQSRQDDEGELVTIQLEDKNERTTKQQSSPASPDLVDFASMMVESDCAMGDMPRNATELPEIVVSHVNDLAQSPTVRDENSREAEVQPSTGVHGGDAGEPPKSRVARSGNKGQLERKSSIKQSRVSDFFGVAR